ncbi:hypothetical protein VZ95_10685 [Elstera litoralis]|uniref:Alginate O-acetyltransferase n=1 Tax=Elstera litoralis TaxID=552518 RepID=A0A0F3ISH4_9PROT|nr:hypothetical protein [Elstera litoralis]KJV09567.1 hypothetical protein VZ95_10685 [Elstera litoralis]
MAALIALVLAAQFTPESGTARLARGLDHLPWWGLGIVLGGALLLIEGLGPQGVAPFIYFQF